jgi:hypothetical protein
VAAVLALVLVAAVGVGIMLKFHGGDSAADAQATDTGSSSALGGAMNSAKDAAVEANVRLIMTGVESYMAQNESYPDPADVSPSGAVGQIAGQWPTNPYTKAPAKSGTSPGDYTYQLVSGGGGYKLTGYGADGPVCTLP